MRTAFFSRSLACLLLAAAPFAALAQNPAATEGVPPPRLLPAPPTLLQQFDVGAGTVQELFLQQTSGGYAVELWVGGAIRTLVMQPHDVRAPGFQLMVVDAQGMHQVPTPPSVTYRGGLADLADSRAAATIVDGSLRAMLRTASGDTWVIQPVREVDPTAGPRVHVVFRSVDSLPRAVTCGVQANVQPAPAAGGEDVLYECQLAIEADYPFYQLNGSNVTTTQNDVTSVINVVDTIYRNDVQIDMLVTQIIVNTVPDPYTSSVASQLLPQFGNYWNAFRGGVVRDTAHLFTGRPMGASSNGAIGIAYLGVTCNVGNAYGVSQSRWSSNLSYRAAVTAHEIGHNFNAGHCDGSPPCYIMCSGIGGCNNVQSTFSQGERSQIIAYRQSIGCLSLLPTQPSLTSASPTTVKTFRPPLVTLNGNGLIGVNQIQVGTSTVTSGISVLSDTQLRFTPPTGLALGTHAVRVVNSAGTSNAINLTVGPTNPIELAAPGVVLGGGTFLAEFGGMPGDHAWFLVGLANTTAPLSGFPVLASFSVLQISLLDTRGLGSYSIPIPPGVLSGLRAYTQVIAIDPTTTTIRSVSNIGNTLFFN
jgi:hypothetical protein